MAWIDLGAYNVLEEHQCVPAHALQDPLVSGWLTPRLCFLVDIRSIKGHSGIDSYTSSPACRVAGVSGELKGLQGHRVLWSAWQAPAVIGDPQETAHPLQRGTSFGFGTTFGGPALLGPGFAMAPAPVYQHVQSGEPLGSPLSHPTPTLNLQTSEMCPVEHIIAQLCICRRLVVPEIYCVHDVFIAVVAVQPH